MSIETTITHESDRPGDRAGLATLGGAALLVAAFLVDALTGALGVAGVHGRSAYPTVYVMLALGTGLLAPGLATTAMTYRRRFGTFPFVGLVSGVVGFVLMSVGAALNLTANSAVISPTADGALVFSGIALSAFAALVTGLSLWNIDVAPSAAGVLVAAFVGFVAALLVGESVAAVAGFDLAWSVVGLLLATGWALFGNYVRTHVDAGQVGGLNTDV